MKEYQKSMEKRNRQLCYFKKKDQDNRSYIKFLNHSLAKKNLNIQEQFMAMDAMKGDMHLLEQHSYKYGKLVEQ